MTSTRSSLLFFVLLGAGWPAYAADIIVSAQDGKFVRVEGRATFPQPVPPASE